MAGHQVGDHVLGLDVGGSSVKAWVATPAGDVVAEVAEPLLTLRPGPHRAELDPSGWWAACRAAAAAAVSASGARSFAGVTVSSLRQGFVLLDGAGAELGTGILNSDRRGAAQLDRVRAAPGLSVTGHWPAPELTLPKLLQVAVEEPERWAAARRLLFVHDWLLWRLTGVQVTEVAYACAGQLADVAARTWAVPLLESLGVRTDLLADLVEAGTHVGGLLPDALPGVAAGTTVVAGCGDTQLAAAGAAGTEPGTVCVVAGSSTPVLAATDAPLGGGSGAWLSTHLRPDRWAAETNAGYPGGLAAWWAGVTGSDPAALWAAAARSVPGAHGVTAVFGTPRWDEAHWATRAPASLVGLGSSVTAEDLARAVVEAHAVTVAHQVRSLADAVGGDGRVVLTGGAVTAGGSGLAALVASVLAAPVRVPEVRSPAARAGVALVTGDALLPAPVAEVAPSGEDYAPVVDRWLRVHAVLHEQLPEEDA